MIYDPFTRALARAPRPQPFAILSGSDDAVHGQRYLATAAGASLLIPDTARPGFTTSLESDTEGTARILLPGTGWKFVYPGGHHRDAAAIQGRGTSITATVVRAGEVAISGSGVPLNPVNWLPTQDANLKSVYRAGTHMPFYDYGGMGGGDGATPQTLYPGSVTRWGAMFGIGALILDGTAIEDTDSYAPREEYDANYSFRKSLLMKSVGTTARQLRATHPPAGPAFSIYLALRYLATPGSTGGKLISLSTTNVTAPGWGSFAGQPQGVVYNTGSNHGTQVLHNGLTVAWGTKPASVNQATNENTTSPLWLSIECTAGGVCTIYSDETLITQGGTSGAAFLPDLFRIETGPPLNLAGVAIHDSVPASTAARLQRQRYYKALFS